MASDLDRPRSGTGPDYVPREELGKLVDDLTVDDVRRARADYAEGDPMRGFAVVYHAAIRTGLAEANEDESAFLSRVRIADLTPLLAKANETLPNAPSGIASLPPSVDSGE